jgi:hypothetical protein
MIRSAAVGEAVWSPTGPAVVRQDCTIVDGRWVCATHEVVHPNNLSATVHEREGDHVVYWLCPEHGPEFAAVPGT